MTDQNGAAAADHGPDTGAAAPVPLERGRYAVFQLADGGLVIARSGPLCASCAGCGCGDQIEPLRVPGMLVGMARAAARGDANVLSAVKSSIGEANIWDMIKAARRQAVTDKIEGRLWRPLTTSGTSRSSAAGFIVTCCGRCCCWGPWLSSW